jgi:phosphomannomutase
VALVLQALAERGAPLSALAAEIPAYRIEKRKIALGKRSLASVGKKLAGIFSGAAADRRDGFRFAWAGSWVHVRPSNTEPVLRVIAEAPTAAEAADLCRKAEQALAPRRGSGTAP